MCQKEYPNKKFVENLSEVVEQHDERYLNQIWQLVLSRVQEKRHLFLLRKVAAVAILLLGVGLFFYVETTPKFVWQEASVAGEAREMINLPDGSIVYLERAGRIAYSSEYGKNQRYIKLEGTALFDVVKNEDVPFVVETDGMKVEVLGTKFIVTDTPQSNHAGTTLLSGSVKVNLTKSTTQVMLDPAQYLSLDKKTAELTCSQVDTQLWEEALQSGVLKIRNKPFRELTKLLESRFLVKIDYEEKKYGDRLVTLSVTEEDLEEVLDLLCAVLHFTYTKNEDKIIIN